MNETTEINVEKHFRHPPERVFDAFLDPVRVGDWLFATHGGVMERTDFDPRPGGRFHIVERRDGVPANHWGEFVEIDRPRRIVFRFWVDAAPDDKTPVTVTFEPSGDGCLVTLVHELEPHWAHYADQTRDGWAMILDSLERTMESDR